MSKYLFTSERLGFRNWHIDDVSEFAKINADPSVMEYFPKVLSTDETKDFIHRLQKHYNDKGYNYFAVETLKNKEFIGFIGLAYQEYETEFTPAVDIGWRLKRTAWGFGYATEGAKRCLDYAFDDLKIDTIVSVCVENNTKSESVMKKIGMIKKGTFKHPKLKEYPTFEKCIWYEIKNKNNE